MQHYFGGRPAGVTDDGETSFEKKEDFADIDLPICPTQDVELCLLLCGCHIVWVLFAFSYLPFGIRDRYRQITGCLVSVGIVP